MYIAQRSAIPAIAAVLLVATSLTAFAAENAKDAMAPNAGPAIDKLTPFNAIIAAPRNLASNIIGSDFYSMEGKKVGTVEDIVLDNDGTMIALKIGVGGLFGVDETHFAVPAGDISFEARNGSLRITGDIVAQDIRDIAGS